MSETRSVVVRFNLFGAIQRLETEKGKRFTYAEIGRKSHLHENMVQRLATAPVVARVDVKTIERLINFFRSEGLTFTIDDLFVVEEAA